MIRRFSELFVAIMRGFHPLTRIAGLLGGKSYDTGIGVLQKSNAGDEEVVILCIIRTFVLLVLAGTR